MKIVKKLVLIITAVNLLCIGALTLVSLVITKNQISTMAYENVRSVAENSGSKISMWLESNLNEARTIATVIYNNEEIIREDRRSILNSMLYSIVDENPDLLAAWAVFEPNALDGMDANFINTPGSDASGRFISYFVRENGGIKFNALSGYDKEGIEGDFYFKSFRSGKEVIIEPYQYLVGGRLRLITSLTVPLKHNGRIIGVAGVNIELTEIQRLTIAIKPFGVGDAAVFSNNGMVVAHPDPSRLGRSMQETEKVNLGIYMESMVQAVKQGRDYRCENYWPEFKSNMLIAIHPINVGNSETPWSFAVAGPVKVIMEPVYRMTSIFIILSAIMLGILTLIVLFISRSITAPLKTMETVFTAIGDGDFTQSLEVRSNDEIGNIGNSLNLTLEKIRTLIITIKSQAGTLFNVGNDLAANMNETAAAVNQITANVQNIKNRIANQNSGIIETNSAMEQITNNINKLSEHIDNQSSSVSKSSSAIEEMLVNIQSVTDTLIKNAEKVEKLTVASDAGRASLEEVVADIKDISQESQGLLEINKVMKNIASQTNLLSMNAAIEAAHAGEAGKGFAVVADEIRKLAEDSSGQSKIISAVLNNIIDSISKITRSTYNVMSKFEAIDEGVKVVAMQEEHIRNAMEEQGTGSKQILEAIGQLNEITGYVKDGSREMLEGSKEVIKESKNLEMACQEISLGMNEMANGSNEINSAVNQINDISGKNKESINILVKEVSRFKVDNHKTGIDPDEALDTIASGK